jgi:ABC-2 type transport system ATP-binding protein
MIHIENLQFGYRKKEILFEGLNLEVDGGSITGLLGKNGAGKTTLLKMMAGLIRPRQGNLSVMGYKPQNRSAPMLSDLFFVPEEFYTPSMSIKGYVDAYSIFYPKFNYDQLHKILAEFELDQHRSLKNMSYGQKKKFLISFALATRCKLLILDEPTNGLDIPGKAMFRKIVAGSLSEEQLVLISTHQVRDVENLLDQLIILDRGQVVFKETMHQVSEQYEFGICHKLEETESLYFEQAPGGYKYIASAREFNESPVDLEILFNAVTSGNLKTKDHVNTIL